MKFAIRRTSVWDPDVSPTKSAKQEELTYLDIRTISLEMMKTKRPDLYKEFTAGGLNHRSIGKGKSCREIPSTGWTIEIGTLDDLLKLHSKEGRLIIKSSNYLECPLEIEIYDDYRE